MQVLEQLITKFQILEFKCLLLKLSKEEQLRYLKEYCQRKYELTELLPDQFYESLLIKVKKDNSILIRKNDIYQIISKIKDIPEIDEYLKTQLTPFQYFEISKQKVFQLKILLEKVLKECKENNLDKMFEHEPVYLLAKHAYFTENECGVLAYKLYLTIGFENAKELLEQKYGEISFKTLYFLFNSIETKNIKVQKGNPMLKEEFVNFFFKNKNSRENTMHLFLDGYYKNIYLNFSYFYQNFEYLQEKLGTKMPRAKVESLLEERFKCSLYPEISGDVISDFKSSFQNKYQFNMISEREIAKINYEFYEKNIKKQYISSIPQIIYKSKNEVIYEILPKNSPRNLVIGYRTNSCFRINGDASILFSKAMISKHYRVLSISTNKEKDIAMCLLARNGNVIIVQGIEISKSYQNMEMRTKIYEGVKETMQELMNIMNKEADEIIAILIGNSNKNVIDFSAEHLSFRLSPVKSMKEDLEVYYDGFHFPQSVLVMNNQATLHDIKLYPPLNEYFDKREEILHWQVESSQNYLYNRIQKRLAVISFKAGVQLKRIIAHSSHKEKEIYCNKDWYIIVFEDGTIESACLDYDFRAKEEYSIILKQIQKKKSYQRKRW